MSCSYRCRFGYIVAWNWLKELKDVAVVGRTQPIAEVQRSTAHLKESPRDIELDHFHPHMRAITPLAILRIRGNQDEVAMLQLLALLSSQQHHERGLISGTEPMSGGEAAIPPTMSSSSQPETLVFKR